MKIHEDSVKFLNFKGIYSLTSVSGKRYIGSTRKSFLSRFTRHFEKLRTNNHQNRYLQNAWKKHTVNGFVFEVLEVLDSDFEKREKYWIEFYDSANREKGYNINPDPEVAPSHTQSVKDKIADTLRQKWASGEINENKGHWKKGTEPWNKGKKYKSTNHLKGVKKGTGRRTKVHVKLDELLEKPEEVNQQPS